MSKVYKIGRQVQLGIAKESTRGTTPGSASYWPAYDGELVVDEDKKFAKDESTYGIIEDVVGQQIVMNSVEATVKGPVTDTSFCLFLLSLMGTQAAAAFGYESTVYTNTFTIAESAQHQSLSLYIHDASIQDYSHANCMVSKLELTYALEKFLEYSATIMGQTGTKQSAYSPSVTQENRFAAPYGTMQIAPTKAQLQNAVTGTGTAASSIHVTAISGFTTDQIAVGMKVTGTNIAAGAYVATIVSSTAFDMNTASTGNAADITVGGLIASGTASSTTSVTSLSINTNLLQVGQQVVGKYVPAGTTISAIISSSALTLSAATTGAMNYIAFGPLTVPMKSMKITLDANVEAFMASGSASPADFFNKEFKCSGSIEAIFRNESDFKTQFMAGTAQALGLTLTNTAVTIGTAANPQIVIQMDQVYFDKLKIKRGQKDLVYATMDFTATYSIANSEMVNVAVTNTVNGF